MSNDLTLFPVLSEDLKQKIQFHQTSYKFYYTDNGVENDLQCKDSDSLNTFSLFDENGHWDIDKHNFGFTRSYSVRFHKLLFGSKGIVCQDAELGIAVIWTSSDSRQRGVIAAQGTIRYSEPSAEIKIKHSFEIAQLRGSVRLKTVLYIKKSGFPFDEEQHLANTYGLILGELSNEILLLDGNGSEFPVVIKNDPDQPLWWVECEWNEPAKDLFAESVLIVLNEGHDDYVYIDKNSPSYNQAMLKEIFSQALLVIITKLKENPSDWEDAVNDNDLGQGSVSEVISYFLNVLDWKLESAVTTSLSIRKFFEGKAI